MRLSINDLMHRFYRRFVDNSDKMPVEGTVKILGSDGVTEVPVRTDAQGRLVIATDINVDVGDITVGTVEQGPKGPGVEPWDVDLPDKPERELGKVSLSGQMVDREHFSNAASAPMDDIFKVGDASHIILRVDGSFEGEIRVYGSEEDTTPAVGDVIMTITEPGTWVFSVSQYRRFRVRLHSLTSGTVTAESKLLVGGLGSYDIDDDGGLVQRVLMAGISAEDGRIVSGPSFAVDPEGYPALRTIDAAPFAYDETTNSKRVLVMQPVEIVAGSSIISQHEILQGVEIEVEGATGASDVINCKGSRLGLSLRVSSPRRLAIDMRYLVPGSATILSDWIEVAELQESGRFMNVGVVPQNTAITFRARNLSSSAVNIERFIVTQFWS